MHHCVVVCLLLCAAPTIVVAQGRVDALVAEQFCTALQSADPILEKLKFSQALYATAEQHLVDLKVNKPNVAPCTLKSWSDKSDGVWKACCHSGDPMKIADLECESTKATEVTGAWGKFQYNGRALEMVSDQAVASMNATAAALVVAHGELIAANGGYAGFKWAALGCAFEPPLVTVWLGEAIDTLDPPYELGGRLPIQRPPPAVASSSADGSGTLGIAVGVVAGGACCLLLAVVLACVCLRREPSRRENGPVVNNASFQPDLGIYQGIDGDGWQDARNSMVQQPPPDMAAPEQLVVSQYGSPKAVVEMSGGALAFGNATPSQSDQSDQYQDLVPQRASYVSVNTALANGGDGERQSMYQGMAFAPNNGPGFQ